MSTQRLPSLPFSLLPEFQLLKNCTLAASLVLFAHTAMADELVVPVGQQGASHADLPRPTTGMTTEQVKNHFGEPKVMGAAVGEPPISMWRYAGFTVYFEYDRVIHSVLAPNTSEAESTTQAESSDSTATDGEASTTE